MQSFNLGASSGAAEWTRTTPTRAPTPSGDVVVPLAQSAITGLVVAIAGGVVAYIQHWPWWAALAAFAGTFALSWFWLLSDHRSLLRITETMTTEDNRPAADERPAAARFEITEHNGPNSDTMRFMDLPVSEATFCHIARGVLAGHPFSERAWGGRGKPLSGPKFRQLQDALMAAGYVRWASDADRRQGVALTRKGEALFRQAAEVGND